MPGEVGARGPHASFGAAPLGRGPHRSASNPRGRGGEICSAASRDGLLQQNNTWQENDALGRAGGGEAAADSEQRQDGGKGAARSSRLRNATFVRVPRAGKRGQRRTGGIAATFGNVRRAAPLKPRRPSLHLCVSPVRAAFHNRWQTRQKTKRRSLSSESSDPNESKAFNASPPGELMTINH